MKNNVLYLFICACFISLVSAQELQLAISKSGSCQFGNSIYSFGLSDQKPHALFRVYQLDYHLKVKDSLVIPLSKTNFENYLQLSSDTLHNYLNIYVQEKDKKQVTIFRFNKQFELVATIENVDIVRLNNTDLFSSELMYYKNSVYTLKTQRDTSGNQFYLNKYVLKSDLKNFDYEFKWQFPFERKQIRSAHIFYADKNSVKMFVHVDDGPKAGQWILKVNAETGKLIRGTKLNSGETGTFLFGSFIADTNSKSLYLIGEKFTKPQFNEKENKLTLANRPFALAYLVTIDSTDDVIYKQDFKIPITNVVSGAKKTNNTYFLRVVNLEKNKDESFSFESDIYGNTTNSFCYSYLNTIVFKLLPEEDKFVLEKSTIASNPLVERFYFTNDKLDMNGKLCADSVTQFEKVVYKSLVLPVKQGFKLTDGTPSWLLEKSNVKKNTITYSLLQPIKKIYDITVLDEALKAENPQLIKLSDQLIFISKQTDDLNYHLKLFTW